MSAGAQVSAFCRDVVKSRKIWTIQFEDGSFMKWENSDGSEIFPIWSTESRVRRVIKLGEVFEGGMAVSFDWEEFLQDWLPKLHKNNVGLGPNWAGEGLSGWSFGAQELVDRVERHQNINNEGT